MSIRMRLAALFTVATLILVGVGGYVYIRQLRAGLESSLDQNLQTRAQTLTAAVAANHAVRLPRGAAGYAQTFTRSGQQLGSSPALAGDRLLTVQQVIAAGHGKAVHVNRFVTLRDGGDSDTVTMRVYGMRMGADGTVLAVATSRDLIDRAVQRSTEQLVVLGAIVLMLAGPGSWLLARGALRPVERMRARAATLQATNAGEGVPTPRTRDEIGRLGGTFNALLARLHAALERERTFVADAGHELRTPLTVLKGELELAQRHERSREELLLTISIAAEETERLIGLTESLLLLAHEGAIPLRSIDLADLLGEAVTSARAPASTRDVRFDIRDEAPGVAYGDPDRLRQAIDNVLLNAVRYSPEGGTVRIRLTREGSDVLVEVADEGPGFPPDFLPAAFERFARADDARSREQGGYGLGLAIVAAIMAAHGGSATAANTLEGGAVVRLRWPQPVQHRPTRLSSSPAQITA